MQNQPECIIEQDKGDRVFLTSANGKNHFWVSLIDDKDWSIEMWWLKLKRSGQKPTPCFTLSCCYFSSKMLFVSGESPFKSITHDVYEFFTSLYEIASDVEVFHTDLSDDNALGFTEVNGDEQFVQVDNNLDEKEFVTTLLHELVHVVQNENGVIDETIREDEAYRLEGILYNNWCMANW